MNSQIVLPLEKMTIAEKLEAMDLIWADLHQRADELPVPDWHLAELKKSEMALANGEDEFMDFDQAMADVRQAIREKSSKK